MFILLMFMLILGVCVSLTKIGYRRGWFLGGNHFHKSNK